MPPSIHQFVREDPKADERLHIACVSCADGVYPRVVDDVLDVCSAIADGWKGVEARRLAGFVDDYQPQHGDDGDFKPLLGGVLMVTINVQEVEGHEAAKRC